MKSRNNTYAIIQWKEWRYSGTFLQPFWSKTWHWKSMACDIKHGDHGREEGIVLPAVVSVLSCSTMSWFKLARVLTQSRCMIVPSLPQVIGPQPWFPLIWARDYVQQISVYRAGTSNSDLRKVKFAHIEQRELKGWMLADPLWILRSVIWSECRTWSLAVDKWSLCPSSAYHYNYTTTLNWPSESGWLPTHPNTHPRSQSERQI